MGYNAYASGNVVLKKGIDKLPEAVEKALTDCFSVVHTKPIDRVVYSFDREYARWDDEVLDTLETMIPYVDECTVNCTGEDYETWQIILHEGALLNRRGSIVYDGVYGAFDIALLERPGCQGLMKEETINLFELLKEDDVYPMEISQTDGNSTAMGFITASAADQLQYEYGQESGLGQFLSEILADMELETPDHVYEYNGLRIKMYR